MSFGQKLKTVFLSISYQLHIHKFLQLDLASITLNTCYLRGFCQQRRIKLSKIKFLSNSAYRTILSVTNALSQREYTSIAQTRSNKKKVQNQFFFREFDKTRLNFKLCY